MAREKRKQCNLFKVNKAQNNCIILILLISIKRIIRPSLKKQWPWPAKSELAWLLYFLRISCKKLICNNRWIRPKTNNSVTVFAPSCFPRALARSIHSEQRALLLFCFVFSLFLLFYQTECASVLIPKYSSDDINWWYISFSPQLSLYSHQMNRAISVRYHRGTRTTVCIKEMSF